MEPNLSMNQFYLLVYLIISPILGVITYSWWRKRNKKPVDLYWCDLSMCCAKGWAYLGLMITMMLFDPSTGTYTGQHPSQYGLTRSVLIILSMLEALANLTSLLGVLNRKTIQRAV